MQYEYPNKKIDNRFTIVPNSIFDILMERLTASEFIVYLTIYRFTRGWDKNSDFIAYSQLENATGLSKSTIIRAIDSLSREGIIQVSEGGGRTPNYYQLNRDYRVSKGDTSGVSKLDTPNKDINKENNSTSYVLEIPKLSNEERLNILRDVRSTAKQKYEAKLGSYPNKFIPIIDLFSRAFSIQPPDITQRGKGMWLKGAKVLREKLELEGLWELRRELFRDMRAYYNFLENKPDIKSPLSIEWLLDKEIEARRVGKSLCKYGNMTINGELQKDYPLSIREEYK